VSICANHNDILVTKKIVEQLTSEGSLPAIDVFVALELLALDSKFNDMSSEYTSLQKRWVKAIPDDRERFHKRFLQLTPHSCLQNLPSHVLAYLL
jgi:hypothetical protein